jgi:ABC-type branched-subunit amino acid transport system substrate-binding protein
MSFTYRTGGSVPLNSPTYIKRQADEDLYQALMDGEFCYVLTPRQMGKSSLRVRVMQQLQNQGLKCSAIDLTGIGSKDITPNQWYYGILKQILKDLNLLEVFDLKKFWKENQELGWLQRLNEFVDIILLKHISENIIVFVDEIDSTMSLPFSSDDFFAWIRYCYNLRVDRPEYQRLTFCLLGVATPTDLIKDKTRTPFNIGRAIEINRFRKEQLTTLTTDLSDLIEDLSEAEDEIYQWTGGQPYLTQQLCQLIQKSEIKIKKRESAEKIGQIVRNQIIDNWQFQGNKAHLQTINDRLLNKDKTTIKLLSIYQKVLMEINVEVSDVSTDDLLALKLTGILILEQGYLLPYNYIYQEVFNQDWVKQKLTELRPYEEFLNHWLENNRDDNYLLVGQVLIDAQQWALTQRLSKVDYQYLTASQKLDANNAIAKANKIINQAWEKANKLTWFAIGIVAFVVLGGIYAGNIYKTYAYCPVFEGKPGLSFGNTCFRPLKTSGDASVFLSSANFYLDGGVKYFKMADTEKNDHSKSLTNYKAAIKMFEKASEVDISDPVSRIFRANAEARIQNEKSIKLAVVTSIDYYEIGAKEVLRGIADAQKEFNTTQSHKRNDDPSKIFIEVVIFNDDNNPEVAKKVARDLVDNENIVGVIGHYASESTKPAEEIYKNNIAVISSTSTGSSIVGDNFFRTVQNTEESSKLYISELYGKDKNPGRLFIFYDPASTYSKDLTCDFINKKLGISSEYSDKDKCNPQEKIKRVHNVSLINIDEDNFNLNSEISRILSKKEGAVLIFTSVKTHMLGITIAKKLAERSFFHVLMNISSSETEIKDNLNLDPKLFKLAEKIKLIRPCPNGENKYEKDTAKTWGLKELNWRTVTSYDAFKAFAKAIEQSEPTNRSKMTSVFRQKIINQLQSDKFSLENKETSGFGVKWSKNHSNEKRKYCPIPLYKKPGSSG